MSSAWSEVEVVSACSPAAESGTILLPKESAKTSRRVLVKGSVKSLVLLAGLRGDSGTGACVSASTLKALGGNKAKVRYRNASFFTVLRRDKWMALQLAIAVLSLAGALLAAYGTWIKNSGEASGGFANSTAVIVFAIATVLAFLKFLSEYHKL